MAESERPSWWWPRRRALEKLQLSLQSRRTAPHRTAPLLLLLIISPKLLISSPLLLLLLPLATSHALPRRRHDHCLPPRGRAKRRDPAAAFQFAAGA
uniref:Uncharacterized protein n=1 Tax=Oryza nivara TaxID=4536 RepID=A0A0E0GLP7_ORYNI